MTWGQSSEPEMYCPEAVSQVLPYKAQRGWYARPTIQPGDIDGEVEQNGFLLYQEWGYCTKNWMEAGPWSAEGRRLELLGGWAVSLHIQHGKRPPEQVTLDDIFAISIRRVINGTLMNTPFFNANAATLEAICREWTKLCCGQTNSFDRSVMHKITNDVPF